MKIRKGSLLIYGALLVFLGLVLVNPSEKRLIKYLQETENWQGEQIIERSTNGVILTIYTVYFNDLAGQKKDEKRYLGFLLKFYPLKSETSKK